MDAREKDSSGGVKKQTLPPVNSAMSTLSVGGGVSGGSSSTIPARSNRVSLRPGRSLVDWMRLGKTGKDLTGLSGQHVSTVSLTELEQHNKPDDCWMALGGKCCLLVY